MRVPILAPYAVTFWDWGSESTKGLICDIVSVRQIVWMCLIFGLRWFDVVLVVWCVLGWFGVFPRSA